MLNEYTTAIATDGSGAATVYLGSRIRGMILAIRYTPSAIATGATLTITADGSGQAVLTKANAGTSVAWYYPVAPANKVADGAASSLSEVPLWLYQDRLKLVVASGGATKAGSITLWVDEPVGG